MHRGSCGVLGGISIHAPRVGSDGGYCPVWLPLWHFNPRSPCGERQHLTIHAAQQPQFQSTLPVWGATSPGAGLSFCAVISIHAPRVGSDRCSLLLYRLPCISIHAPRVGSDFFPVLPYKTVRNISIHAPRVGSDRQGADQTQTETISIHAPRVGSDTADESSLAIAAISIHAPRVGSDSRRPGIGLLACISIHAPRVGSDGHHGYGGGLHLYFNPRSPCGERRSYAVLLRRPKEISIHAPRVGSDPSLTRRSSKEA